PDEPVGQPERQQTERSVLRPHTTAVRHEVVGETTQPVARRQRAAVGKTTTWNIPEPLRPTDGQVHEIGWHSMAPPETCAHHQPPLGVITEGWEPGMTAGRLAMDSHERLYSRHCPVPDPSG